MPGGAGESAGAAVYEAQRLADRAPSSSEARARRTPERERRDDQRHGVHPDELIVPAAERSARLAAGAVRAAERLAAGRRETLCQCECKCRCQRRQKYILYM